MMIVRKFLAVASCLLALTSFACAQSQGDNQQGNSQQKDPKAEQNKPGPSNFGVGVPAIQPKAADQGATQAKVYEPDCGKPKDQPDADLCTQRRVANAAEEALQYNLAQTLIGALGVAFVVVTLGYTVRASNAAAIAAQAAVDAVGSERAWLSFQGIGIFPATNANIFGQEYKESIAFQVVWVNAGRSPAVKSNIYVNSKVLDMNEKVPNHKTEDAPAAGMIGPGITANSNLVAIFGDDLIQFKQRNKKLVIWSRATYETTYHAGIQRHTEMCAELTWNGTRARPGSSDEMNINIVLVGDFNSAS